jgi:hypothetical protein
MTELLKSHRDDRYLDRTSGIAYIRRIAMSNPGVTIRLGVDGLDELCREHLANFLHDLEKLSDIQNIRFLFFIRDTDDIRRHFRTNSSVAYLPITETMTVGDRQLFVQERIKDHSNRGEIDNDLCTLIIGKLAAQDFT